jgi:hypothetical protein
VLETALAIFRKVWFVIGTALLAAATERAAQAPESLPENHVASRSEWVDQAAEHYAGVAAGVEINRICSILPATEAEQLEKDLEAFTRGLSGRIRAEFLDMVRETSQEVASEEPYKSCGSDARRAVIEAQELAAWWLKQLDQPDQSQ